MSWAGARPHRGPGHQDHRRDPRPRRRLRPVHAAELQFRRRVPPAGVRRQRGDHPGRVPLTRRAWTRRCARSIEAACERGGTSIHSTGSSPGFISEAVPLVLTSTQRQLDSLADRGVRRPVAAQLTRCCCSSSWATASDPAAFDRGRWAHGDAELRPVAPARGRRARPSAGLGGGERRGGDGPPDDGDRGRDDRGRDGGGATACACRDCGAANRSQLHGHVVLHDGPRCRRGTSGPTGWRLLGGRRRAPGRGDALRRPARGDGRAGARVTRPTAPSTPCRSSAPRAPGIRTTVDLPQIIGPRPRETPGRPVRPLPELTPATEWFWTSGADGHLRIQGCTACATLVHPPVPDLPGLP